MRVYLAIPRADAIALGDRGYDAEISASSAIRTSLW